ncbi:uncharacterized protein LOC107316672 [Coturnix japonica]|uniref:uncharacterized protein LOC107316672 n=1 Tax=Coturnix japonica TaxID=93934 RepID=UPI0007776340|nr:uncharacterized protein LOC107316672 [Coturnix japonica]
MCIHPCTWNTHSDQPSKGLQRKAATEGKSLGSLFSSVWLKTGMYRGPRAKRGNCCYSGQAGSVPLYTQAGRAPLPEEGVPSSSINTCLLWGLHSRLTPGSAVSLEQGAVLSQCVSFTTRILCVSTKRKCSPDKAPLAEGFPHRPCAVSFPICCPMAMNFVGRSYTHGSFRGTAHQQIKEKQTGPRGSVLSCQLVAVTGSSPAPAQALPKGFYSSCTELMEDEGLWCRALRAVIDERSDPALSSLPAPLPKRPAAHSMHGQHSVHRNDCLNSSLETGVVLRDLQHHTVPHQPRGHQLSWQCWPFVLPVCSLPLFLLGCSSLQPKRICGQPFHWAHHVAHGRTEWQPGFLPAATSQLSAAAQQLPFPFSFPVFFPEQIPFCAQTSLQTGPQGWHDALCRDSRGESWLQQWSFSCPAGAQQARLLWSVLMGFPIQAWSHAAATRGGLGLKVCSALAIGAEGIWLY